MKLLLLFAITLFAAISIASAETIQLSSASMQPTINIGDIIVIDREYYSSKPVSRGDIVAIDIGSDNIQVPGQKGLEVIKRVVALGGDTIEVKGGSLIVNSKIVEEDYAVWRNGGKMKFEVQTIPENTVFILGDNRDFSNDSRIYQNPFISISNLRGKVSLTK